MRMKALFLVATIAAATAMPAAAQSYSRNCNAAKSQSQVGGAIIGGILGGVLGSNVAASGHRGDGTAVGAVLGGLVGSGIGNGSVNCNAPSYPTPSYSPSPYSPQPYGYGSPPPNMYPVDPGYSTSGYGRDDDDYWERGSPSRDNRYYEGRLYPDDNRSYNQNDDYAGRDCTQATQITRLPDGTVIRRPVEACRDAHYGDWQVRD
jgi:hypothetical protein